MTTSKTLDCIVRYDPQADAATLRFDESSAPAGRTWEITLDGHLVGTLRLNSDGEFNYLEILGARRRIARFIPGLTAPSVGVRDFDRGTFGIPVRRADDGSAVIVHFDADPPDRADTTVEVPAASSIPVATIGFDHNQALDRMKLYNTGSVLRPFDRMLGPVADGDGL